MAQSQAVVPKMYRSVIEDVVNTVREHFLDEGVDEQVLLELKQIWETKLMGSKAIEPNPDHHHDHPQPAGHQANHNHATKHVNTAQQQQQSQQQQQQQQAQQQQQQALNPAQMGPALAITDPHRLIPVQITIPAQGTNRPSKALTIQVPALALQGNQLQAVLSHPSVAATFALPGEVAQSALQQQIAVALRERGIQFPGVLQAVQYSTQTVDPKQQLPAANPVAASSGVVTQLDGAGDTSDEEDEDEEEEDQEEEEDNDKDDEDNDEENEFGVQEEPLNSEDDVSEDDPTELFDTENVVVCQYDKITRSRNKWKFHLKDGIMNLNGKDYVFQKANGDAEW